MKISPAVETAAYGHKVGLRRLKNDKFLVRAGGLGSCSRAFIRLAV